MCGALIDRRCRVPHLLRLACVLELTIDYKRDEKVDATIFGLRYLKIYADIDDLAKQSLDWLRRRTR